MIGFINMNDVEGLIKLKSWRQLARFFAPQIIACRLPFREGIITAHRMLFNDEYDDDIRDYSVRLLFAIRDVYREEWDSDLSYDVLLGDACGMTRRYDEKYVAFKRAYDKADQKTPYLLLSLAGCSIAPDLAPVAIEEAENLVKRALDQELSIEAVVLMRGICTKKKDQKGFDHWNEVFQEVKKKQLRSRSSHWPDFLSEISLDD